MEKLADATRSPLEVEKCLVSLLSGHKLKLKRDKGKFPEAVINLQKVIDASMLIIHIEQLLMEMDRETDFSRHIIPVQQHHARKQKIFRIRLTLNIRD
ncbi:hypothetical protein M0G74_05870 [Microbulbifer sp. CAU 1566]|uniref:hypothetical protein n=1 Tax=Microbulbifer sp. CAU 1566 TaxID=2933269 RepID=UPI00200394CF|nr:hypothetical protein [Microbulbifer sp. CAU 1566]MCK7596797.1 hypothetical protein [Microbulbifer sp. CAU 1566]